MYFGDKRKQVQDSLMPEEAEGGGQDDFKNSMGASDQTRIEGLEQFSESA